MLLPTVVLVATFLGGSEPLALTAAPLNSAVDGATFIQPDGSLPGDGVLTPSALEAAPDSSAADLQDSNDKKPETPPHTGFHALFFGLLEDIRALPSMPNAYIAAGGGALALAVHPADATLNANLQSHAAFADAFWKPGHIVGGSPVQMAAAAAIFAYGRLEDAPKASHFGMDLLRAQLIAGGLTEIIKYSVRRERPDHSDNLSFSSGHAATTFATATVIERHLGWKLTGVGYAIATYVATSRLHDNVHYLSDVVFGAAVGTISGRTVTRHGRNYWTFNPVPTPGGVAILVTRTNPN